MWRVVGHLPKKISRICNLFLENGGDITCTVHGNRRYSADGGWEILLFQGKKEVMTLLSHALKIIAANFNVAITRSRNNKILAIKTVYMVSLIQYCFIIVLVFHCRNMFQDCIWDDTQCLQTFKSLKVDFHF